MLKTKTLKVVKPDRRLIEEIEKEIKRVFYREVYTPLMREASQRPNTVKNSMDELTRAVSEGRVYFNRGYFKGSFNAKISKAIRDLGGSYDRKKKAYRLPKSNLTEPVKYAIASSEASFVKTVDRVKTKLSQFDVEDVVSKMRLEQIFDQALFQIDRDIGQGLEGIMVAAKMTPKEKENFAKEYTNNLRLTIKDWTAEETRKMRENIQKNVLGGARRNHLIDVFKKSYGASGNKAKFWARQETNLMLEKFKQSRYTSNGVNEYEWRTVKGSPLHPVRPDHEVLNKTIQRFDQPPVVDRKTGRRANPGEDYNCRCFAAPIVRLKSD
tara:strand:- start:31131 stop:32105 length:975 start_codon:yes stop_codon:yes gene_type:complete